MEVDSPKHWDYWAWMRRKSNNKAHFPGRLTKEGGLCYITNDKNTESS